MAEAKKKTSRRRMTPAEWAEVKALWESGEYTLQQISDKTNFSKEHLSRKFKKEGVEKGTRAQEIGERVASEVMNSTSESARVLARRVIETREEHYQWASAIGKMAMQELARTRTEKVPIATAMENLKALDRLMSVQQRVRAERYVCLGIDKEDFIDDDTLPSLSIQDFTEEEMADIRRQAEQNSGGVDDGLGGILPSEGALED